MFAPSIAGGAHRRLPATSAPVSNVASFTNPQPVQKVWDPGVQYTGIITVPTGYENTITWQIIQHETFAVETSGSGPSVAYTFAYKGANNVNTYALLVHATKVSFPDIWMLLPGEFTCVKRFTRAQADRIITMSGSTVTGGSTASNWTPTNGFKIWVEGTYNGTARPLNFFYWNSTDPMNPVIVQFDNATITTTVAQSIAFGSNQNIIFNGCINESVQYGLTIIRPLGSGGENIYVTPADSTHESYNWTICGMHVNNTAFTNGGTGFVVQMTNNAVFNDNTYRFTRFTVFNMFMENVSNEAYYLGHTRDTDTVPFSKLTNCLYYRLLSNHSRNEGLQIGGHIQAEVFLSSFLDTGLGLEGGQSNNWQLNGGNDRVYIYMNYGKTAHEVTQQFPSITGHNTECFSNITVTTTTTTGQNYLVSFVQSSVYPSITYSSYNNLIIAMTNDNEVYSLYGSPASTIIKFYADGNMFVGKNTVPAASHNGFNLAANSIVNIKMFLDTQLDDIFFFNAGNNDYRIATLASPVFNFTRNATAVAARIHPWGDFDFWGFKYNPANIAAGPDSGILLMTGNTQTRNIVSASSVPDITNVPNGTSFANLQSFYLPAKVLVSNNDGSTRKLPVVWLQGTYNGSVAGTYALVGNFTLPTDITNISVVQAHVNVTVGNPAPPVNLQIDTGPGVVAGWFNANSPTGPGVVDFGQIGSTGIGFRALNSSNKQWTGTLTSGGSNSTVFPGAVQSSLWYNFAPSGSDCELYETTPGALSGAFTMKFLSARSGVAGPRTVQISTQSGQSGSVNCANNADNLITLSGVTAIGGVIRITVLFIAPNDNNGAYLNGFTLDSQ